MSFINLLFSCVFILAELITVFLCSGTNRLSTSRKLNIFCKNVSYYFGTHQINILNNFVFRKYQLFFLLVYNKVPTLLYKNINESLFLCRLSSSSRACENGILLIPFSFE